MRTHQASLSKSYLARRKRRRRSRRRRRRRRGQQMGRASHKPSSPVEIKGNLQCGSGVRPRQQIKSNLQRKCNFAAAISQPVDQSRHQLSTLHTSGSLNSIDDTSSESKKNQKIRQLLKTHLKKKMSMNGMERLAM